MSQQHLQIIEDYVDKMPSLSTTVTKVLEVCDQPGVSPNDLNKIISMDPVLAGTVLKLINSAFYSLPSQISSLTRAIIVLGLNTVKNLALSTAVLSTMKQTAQQSLSMDDFWKHSLSVGVIARAIAIENKVPALQREEYFLSGLLHDLGKIPMAHCFPDEYSVCLNTAEEQQLSLNEAELATFGFEHQYVGHIIAAKWQLSDSMLEVMKHHHAPERSNEDHRLLISSVAIADVYANIFAMGSAGNHFIAEEYITNLLAHGQLSWNVFAQLHETIQESVDKASIFLKVS